MKKMNSVEKELNELIEKILHCLLWANKLSEDDAEISRYNKSILNKVYECLNKSIALLNSSMFVNIITNLLQQQQTNEKLQRKTLDIFNGRLRDETTPENEVSSTFFLNLKFLQEIKLNFHSDRSVLATHRSIVHHRRKIFDQ